jgi:hypothetical protein
MRLLANSIRRAIGSGLPKGFRAAFEREFSVEGEWKEGKHGKSNVLIVAPHGFPGDDDNTDYLAYLVSHEIGGSYLINNKRNRKPNNPSSMGSPADLNDPNQDSPDTKEFLKRLITAVRALRQKGKETPLVITIHGLGDRNADAHGMDFCLGAGFEEKDIVSAFREGGRATAAKELVESFCANLEKEGYRARVGVRGYAAINAIPSFLRDKRGEIGPVDSLQLEIRFTGLREPENLASTAHLLGDVIRALPGQMRKRLPSD